MLTLVVLSALFSAVACRLETPAKLSSNERMTFQQAYRKFKPKLQSEHVLTSSKGDAKQRLKFFRKARKEINKINADTSSGYSAEVNQFAIMSDDEKLSFVGLNISKAFSKAPKKPKRKLQKRSSSTLSWWPNEVTAVKDQGSCGSCWSFAGITVLESRAAISGGDLRQYSEQEIIDCNSSGQECEGGWYDTVWAYAKSAGRLASESDYEYNGVKGSCKSGWKSNSLDTSVSSYNSDGGWSEADLVADLQGGPVAIAVNVGDDFMYYSRGDFTSCVDNNVNHAVVAVGYDESIWFVRNSWGAEWGVMGYIRLSRNVCTDYTYSYYSAYVTMSGSQEEEE